MSEFYYDVTYRVSVDCDHGRDDDVEEYVLKSIPRHTSIGSTSRDGHLLVSYVPGFDSVVGSNGAKR